MIHRWMDCGGWARNAPVTARLLAGFVLIGLPTLAIAQFSAPVVAPGSTQNGAITSPMASSVFDKEAAAEAWRRQTPVYIESILVVGVDPNARKAVQKTLEQRFADSLNAPPPDPAAGIRPLDTTPCMSMASTWNNIGSSFAPMTGCPR